VRILIVTVPLPTLDNPNTMAPLARQIQSLRDLGVQVDVLEVKGMSKFKYLQTLPALYAQVASVDLVHAHYGYCGWLARSQTRKPVVVSFMGDDLLGTPNEQGRVDPFSKLVVQINRWFARTVDAVIVKSAEMAEQVKPVRAHVVPNGVDMQTFRPIDSQEARLRLGWPEGKRYVLFPDDPDNPRKQFSLAQAVVKRAAEEIKDPLELIALNQVPPDQVPFYMNGSDVMMMTSYIEGSPNVVKEALACNLPVVSVPVGDVPELLDGVMGYMVCPRDVELLAQALVGALSNGQDVNGRSVLKRKELDLESVGRRLIRIYADVLENRSRN